MLTLGSFRWSAVVCGAVLRGIEGAIITEKRCRRHYGIKRSRVYDSALHKPFDKKKRRVFKHDFEDKWMLTGFMHWMISKVCHFSAIYVHLN